MGLCTQGEREVKRAQSRCAALNSVTAGSGDDAVLRRRELAALALAFQLPLLGRFSHCKPLLLRDTLNEFFHNPDSFKGIYNESMNMKPSRKSRYLGLAPWFERERPPQAHREWGY